MGISLIKQKSDKSSSSGQSEKEKCQNLLLKVYCVRTFSIPPLKKKKEKRISVFLTSRGR